MDNENEKIKDEQAEQENTISENESATMTETSPSVIDGYIKKLSSSKSRLFVLIFAVLSAITAFLYMADIGMTAAVTVFMLSIVVASAANIAFAVDTDGKFKYGSDIVLCGAAFVLLGLVVRIIQLGLLFALRYFIAYTIFAAVFVMLVEKLGKNKGNGKLLIGLLAVMAAYEIFEFFYLKNTIMSGFIWKLYHISSALLFADYIVLLMMNGENDFSEKIGGYKKQIPSVGIAIAIVAVIAVVFGGIGAVKSINSKPKSEVSVTEESTSEPAATDSAAGSKKGNSVVTTPAPTSSVTQAPKKTISAAELDNLLSSQNLAVQRCKYSVQDTRYKSLYPDMLQAYIINNSQDDIKDAEIAFVAWDSNNLPCKIKGKIDFSDGAYLSVCDFSDINLVPGATFGDDYGMQVDENNDIVNLKAFALSYTTFEGKKWVNPYKEVIEKMYGSGVKFSDDISTEIDASLLPAE